MASLTSGLFRRRWERDALPSDVDFIVVAHRLKSACRFSSHSLPLSCSVLLHSSNSPWHSLANDAMRLSIFVFTCDG